MASQKIPRKYNISPENRKLSGERLKAMWANPENREKWLKAKSELMKERMNTPEAKKAAGERISAFNRTDKARKSRSASSKSNWKNPEVRERMLLNMMQSRAEYFKSQPVNEFEARCYDFIDSLGAVYERQYPIPEIATIVDAYIRERNICIYFDSDYWHGMPVNQSRDSRIREHLRALGYHVLVIRCDHHAREINNEDLLTVQGVLCGA